jgi:DnaJ-class molecular chaperone
VITTAPISLATAMLGGTVSVATLKGEVDVTIKAGTAMGSKKRLPQYGIRDPSTHRTGDHYVKLELEVSHI